MTITTLRRVDLAGAASVILVASLAQAAPSAQLRTLDVEVIDVSKNGAQTTRFALAIDDGNRPARANGQAGTGLQHAAAHLAGSSSSISFAG